MGKRDRSEGQGPMGTGESGAEEGQPSRGTNRGGTLQYTGITGLQERGEHSREHTNMVNEGWTGVEHLYKPIELKILPCACKGLWKEALLLNLEGSFSLPASAYFCVMF